MRQETLSSSQESLSGGNGKIEKQKIFKIIVIGDSNVGKTCLTYRFCCGKFPVRAEATIGVDFREKVLHIGADTIKLQLWDTAGQERFRKSMIKHYYRNVHAVVFVYDMTKMSTFHSLDSWIEECNHNLSVTDIPKIIVGNKCDEHDHVVVSTNVAQQYADGHNMPHFETSAKCDSQSDHVEAIFMTLAHKLKDSKPLMRPPTIYKPESVIIQRSYHQTTSASASDSCGC